jgi:hypothetical protein
MNDSKGSNGAAGRCRRSGNVTVLHCRGRARTVTVTVTVPCCAGKKKNDCLKGAMANYARVIFVLGALAVGSAQAFAPAVFGGAKLFDKSGAVVLCTQIAC